MGNTVPWSSELRLFAGESGCADCVPGRAVSGLASTGGSVALEGGAGGVAIFLVAGVDVGLRGAGASAARRGTVGSKGSMGEYCVAASTPTYCFGRGCDGDLRGLGGDGEGWKTECLECRRRKDAVILGDWWGERVDGGSGA